jgi:hypothetical protein
MALTQKLIVDQIEVVSNGTVQVRILNQITDDATTPHTTISNSFHRHVVVPGQDYSGEDAKVQAICAVIHTPDVVAAYEVAQKASQVPLDGSKV